MSSPLLQHLGLLGLEAPLELHHHADSFSTLAHGLAKAFGALKGSEIGSDRPFRHRFRKGKHHLFHEFHEFLNYHLDKSKIGASNGLQATLEHLRRGLVVDLEAGRLRHRLDGAPGDRPLQRLLLQLVDPGGHRLRGVLQPLEAARQLGDHRLKADGRALRGPETSSQDA